MSGEFAGARVLVTGAAQGIGEAVALGFAERGARVLMSDLTGEVEATARRVVETFPSSEAAGLAGDVAEPAMCEALAAAARQRFGGIDILVVSGASLQERNPVATLPPAEWDRIMAANARAPYLLCRSAIPLLPRPGGRIVLVGSYTGQAGFKDHAAYSASKGAVLLLVKSLALELAADGITVNCVAPAYVESAIADKVVAATAAKLGKTPDEVRAMRASQIPLGRPARAGEVAAAVLFLASPAASYVTGACLDVNGGVGLR